MILEAAIGDAYGAGFEFAPQELIQKKNLLTQYEPHPLFPEILGKYTDDTQMSIAITELILSKKEWNLKEIYNHFYEAFKRDPRRGYAKRFHQFLTEINSAEEFEEKIINTSERNGAIMRAYPIGVYSNEKEVIKKATLQAKTTHNTVKAIIGAQTIALTSHFFLYNKGKRKDLLSYLKKHTSTKWNAKWEKEVSMDAFESVEAVLTILLGSQSYSEILQKSVNLGGDVDTVASLAMALGSICNEITKDTPKVLYQNLENEKYGRSYLENLDKKLIEFIKAQKDG